jgi:hypothetical protein
VAKWFDSISDMASHALLQLQGRVIRLIEILSDSSVRSRLVWAYASICRADQRGYRRDDFRSLRTEARTVAMKKLVTEPDKDHQTEAAYYFNNALFRMVIVAEIGLKQLYKSREGLDPPDDWLWITSWYERTYQGPIKNLRVARREINEWKHRERGEPNGDARRCETLQDGIKVLREVLDLLEALPKVVSK